MLLLFDVCWWNSHTGGRVLPLQWKLGKRRKSVWRRRIYRKYVSWNQLQKTQDEIYADVVLRRSRGFPGQWFLETDYLCASAIFVVGTSGIPPKLNYRSVKSYSTECEHINYWKRLVHFNALLRRNNCSQKLQKDIPRNRVAMWKPNQNKVET